MIHRFIRVHLASDRTGGECRSALKAARRAGASYEGRAAAMVADGEDV